MKLKTPQVLLLDVMDTVVVDPFFADDFGEVIGCARSELLAQMTPDLWPQFERGELSAEVYYSRFFRDGRGVDGPRLERWMADRYRFVPGMESLLQQLKELGVPMYALSNYPVWWRLIEERLQLSRWMKWGFVSCELGVRKPDADAYLIPASRLEVDPSVCLFVDDRESNCEGARAVGMDATRFESTEALRAALVARGLPL